MKRWFSFTEAVKAYIQRIGGDWCVSILRHSFYYHACYKMSVSFSKHHFIRAAATEKMEEEDC